MTSRRRPPAPFDLQRDGFVMGEGGGVLILERADHALRRDVPVLAEVVGYASRADAYHVTQPSEDGEGAARAMAAAVEQARIDLSEVDYINAHGTSTAINDRVETVAIKRVFGEAAYDIAISSTKSMTGHLMGAAGGIEAVACIRAINEGIIPPTINLASPRSGLRLGLRAQSPAPPRRARCAQQLSGLRRPQRLPGVQTVGALDRGAASPL